MRKCFVKIPCKQHKHLKVEDVTDELIRLICLNKTRHEKSRSGNFNLPVDINFAHYVNKNTTP